MSNAPGLVVSLFLFRGLLQSGVVSSPADPRRPDALAHSLKRRAYILGFFAERYRVRSRDAEGFCDLNSVLIGPQEHKVPAYFSR